MELATLILAIVGSVFSLAVLILVLVTRKGRGSEDAITAVQDAVRREMDAAAAHTATLLGTYNQTVDQHMQMLETRLAEDAARTETRLAEIGDRMQQALSAQRVEMEQKLNDVRTLLDNTQRESLRLTAERLDAVRAEVVAQLSALREENNQQLERMRKVVDKELHESLQNSLNESFGRITDNLNKVYQSMGEMHAMTSGMNDLKRVLSGVKTRGVWGEASLATLLSELLSSDQYVTNFAPTPRSGNVVEFAIRLPGKEEGADVYLPIDSKFPLEDYERLVEAADNADREGVEQAGKALETRIKAEARDIRDKYIKPPRTTAFAILYVPIEGLYAEVMRRVGLAETLRNDYSVLVAGPTTLAALINSLRVGFTTMAVERRSKEIWQLLATIQRQFNRFADSLARAEKQLDTAARTLHETGERTRKINNKLASVQQLEQYAAADTTDDLPDTDDTEGDE